MLHYVRAGSGETLVLIHGFLGGNTIFHKQIAALQQHFDVIAVDLPGHGESEMERESYTMYDYANAVIDVLVKENVDEAYWLGHSMGGYIVLAALEKEMANIKKIILAYSSDVADTDEAIEKRTKQQQEIFETGGGAFIDGIIDVFFKPDAQTEDILYAKEVANDATDEGLLAALQAMKERADQRALVETSQTPILVVEGEYDKAVTPINTANSNVQKIKTPTGHLGMLEEPTAFIKAVS